MEQALEFCREDECVEVTPKQVRVRKVILDQNERGRATSRTEEGEPGSRFLTRHR
jgi:GTP-binding protein